MTNIINQCNEENYAPLLEKVMKKAFKMQNISKKKTLTIILVTNAKMRELNRNFTGKDAITDVLTFPSDIEDELGDVFIAPYVAMEQAKAYGHGFKRELAFLAVHGFLHAIGYTHDTEEKETMMFKVQENILDELKIRR
ncbi:MAG: rRNA maturation RNase YbeY [Bacillota bacterium]